MTDKELEEKAWIEWLARNDTNENSSEEYKRGFIDGYKSRDEEVKWYYPDKGDLPEENKMVIVIADHEIGMTIGKRRKQYRKYEWYLSNCDGTFCFLDKEIIAWQYLPEPPEEITND